MMEVARCTYIAAKPVTEEVGVSFFMYKQLQISFRLFQVDQLQQPLWYVTNHHLETINIKLAGENVVSRNWAD